MKPKQRGFTLIELLVVIAIIGILSSVVLASLNTARGRARDAQRKSEISSIRTALELYYSSTGSYPNGTFFSVWDGTNRTGCWNGSSSGGMCALVTAGFLPQAPHDPGNVETPGNYLLDQTPSDQGYVYWSDGQRYMLGTNVETGGGTPSRCGNTVLYSGLSTCPI